MSSNVEEGMPRKTTYESRHVDIPRDFLQGPSQDPVVMARVAFADSQLPEYESCFAVTLDNVLSRGECEQLIRLAEQSTPPGADGSEDRPWRPAMVNIGPGIEVLATGYRNSDRIVWDHQEVVNRLWARCCQADGLGDMLATYKTNWRFSRVNDRMRFLRYKPGDYFKPHADGAYYYKAGKKQFKTQYTVHLYLNDSATESPESDLEGGATAFLSHDEQRRLDVNPKAGSVLIFQHNDLLHEGAVVTNGLKYTMRTDILYEWLK